MSRHSVLAEACSAQVRVDPLLTGLHQLNKVFVQHISVPITETFSFVRHLSGKEGVEGGEEEEEER